MANCLEIKTTDNGYVEAELTKQEDEILLRLSDEDDVVAAVILDKQQTRWLINWLSEKIGIAPEVTRYNEEQQAMVENATLAKVVRGECEECGQTVLTPLKHFPDTLKDAARYRWLRDHSLGQYEHPIAVSQRRAPFDTMQYVGPLVGEPLDKAIDQAISVSLPQKDES